MKDKAKVEEMLKESKLLMGCAEDRDSLVYEFGRASAFVDALYSDTKDYLKEYRKLHTHLKTIEQI